MRRGAEAAGSGRDSLVRVLRRTLAAAIVAAAALFPSAHPAAAQETLRSGTVTIDFAPRQRGLARQVLAAATRPFRLPGLGSASAPDSTTIILAPTPAAFRAATGGGAPEWAGGVAIPELRRIVIPAYPSAGVRDDEKGTVLRHEVVHLVLHDRLPEGVPRWFDEGYAEVASGGWDVEGAWQLRLALLTGAAPPLDSLELGWPARAEEARTAYLLSATAVDYLRRRAGEEGMALLFSNWREQGDFERALRTTFGITLGQLEDEWRGDVKLRYGWLLAASNLAVVWLAATVLVLAAWLPRRRRNRRKLAEMDAEERMLPPARPEMADVVYPIPEPPLERE